MPNCRTCKFNSGMLCHNPKNYQPQFRSYVEVKYLSPRFYPKPPNWCKGWAGKDLKFCVACEKVVDMNAKFTDQMHFIIKWPLDWDICTGPFADSPPPPILSDEQWETVFANEPSDAELEMMDREAETLR